MVVDVREPWEAENCRIEGAELIPLDQFAEGSKLLDPARPIYLYCHHGGRSLQAAAWLRQKGYPMAASVADGIHAWAEEIDSAMARY